MSVVTALVSHLLNHAEVTALVANRIYPDEIPPSTSEQPNLMPLLTYKLLSDPPSLTHDRKSTYVARIQVDSWGGTYKSTHAAAAAVDQALHGYRGAMGSEGLPVGICQRSDKRDNPNAENVDLFHVESFFTVHYKE